ncbi:MAG: DNA-directed RNA polymerase subunit omega [bacterium]
MDSPSIDSLLVNVPGVFELAAAAGRRAIDIKRRDRENTQPLQQALDEISDGNVDVNFRKPASDDSVGGEQIQLPLEVKAEQVKFEHAAVHEMGGEHFDDDEEEDEKVTHVEENDDLAPEVGVFDDEYPHKILDDDFKLDDDE